MSGDRSHSTKSSKCSSFDIALEHISSSKEKLYMPKHFCWCLSLKTGAFLMAFLNLMEGLAEFVTGIVQLCYIKSEGDITLYVVCLLLGIITMGNGVLLLAGIIQAKEKYILLYLLLGSSALFIVTIYSGILMFATKSLTLITCLSVFMWYGQFVMYNFYEEVAEYNTVNSGVIEIAYNGEKKSYANSGIASQESVESTAV